MRTKIALAIVCAGLLLMECANVTGGSTETSSKVAGILYNDDGTRAAGAKVACIPRKHNPYDGTYSGGDSTTTDDTGAYKFEIMPADTYDILASKDSSMAYRDPVVVTADANTYVPPDTLRPAGSIRGVVRFEEGGDPSTIFILFFGTRTFTWPDDSLGNFTSGNMAAGQYRVRILTTTPDYLPANDTFDVRAGINDVLADTIVLKYTGIPIPRNLQIQYDTLKQIVTLTWNRPVSGRPLLGYNIYRKHQDSALVLLKSDWADTVYHDSTGIQDITYEYRVAAIDTNTTEGTRSAAVSVIILGAYNLVFSGGYGTGTGNGYFNNLSAITSGINGRIYCADAYNYRIQIFDSSGTYLSSWGKQGTGQGEFGDRITALAADSLGNIYVVDDGNNRIQKFDADSNFISEWTSPDTGWQGFWKIAIHTDSLFVGSNYGIQIFNLQGQYIATIPEIDGRPNPFGIAPTDSFVYVAQNNPFGEIILRYSYGGLFIDTLLFRTATDTSLGGGRIDDLCYSRNYNQLLYLDRTDERIRGIELNGIEAWHFAPHYSFTQISYQYSMSLAQDNSILIGYTDGHFQKYRPITILRK